MSGYEPTRLCAADASKLVRALTWFNLKLAAGEVRARLHERVLVFRAGPAAESGSGLRQVSHLDANRFGLPYAKETLADNWANGWGLYAWWDADVPVSFAWARVAPEHRITEVRARVRSAVAVGWIVHCITPEEFRGRGYYPRLIHGVAGSLPAPSTYIYCVESNRGSRRGIEKAGYEAVGSVSRTLGRLSASLRDITAADDRPSA